jgi:hypothetical protein
MRRVFALCMIAASCASKPAVKPASVALAHAGERRYELITVELPDQSQHTVYFDITDNWNNWKPK